MRIEKTFLRSRVARRVFALFVVSSLIPMLALSGLALEQVSQHLLDRAERSLRDDAKGIGMRVLDRLNLMGQELDVIARRRNPADRSRPVPLADRPIEDNFVAIARLERSGPPTAVMGELAAVPWPDEATLEHVGAGSTAVLLLHGPGSGAVRIVLLRDLSRTEEPALVAGEVRADKLWDLGLPEQLALCVLLSDASSLHCPAWHGTGTIDLIARSFTARRAAPLAMDVPGEGPYLWQAWNLFMDGAFATDDWTIVLGTPQAQVLAPIEKFRALFVPAVLAALLLVALLSLAQIRRHLVPLEKLREGTVRIAAREFDARIDVPGKDEFAELAGAFNDMAATIGRQFETLETLTELDRLILSSLDADYIIETLLDRLPDVMPCDVVGVFTFEHGSRVRAVMRTKVVGHPALEVDEQWLSAGDLEALDREAQSIRLGPGDAWPRLLGCMRAAGAHHALLLPVHVGEELSAVIAMGHAATPHLEVDDLSRVRSIADRAAVALSNAAWEEMLYQQAHFDVLTGLPNRVLLRERLSQAIVRSRDEGARAAVLFVDLDRFKAVNDSLGHGSGDGLLKAVADRLRERVVHADVIARFGGDEFVIVLSGAHSDEEAAARASATCRTILDAVLEPVEVDGHRLQLSASIGVALYPSDATDFDGLLRNADAAMYHAKDSGKGRYQFYASELNAKATERLKLETELRNAIERDELQLHYQAKVDPASGRIVSAECLLRWEHPELGFVPPTRFIPVAEETGLVVPIGDWVVEKACSQLAEWRAAGMDDVQLAVNVSARHFMERDVASVVLDALRRWDVPARQLEVEVTEGAVMDDVERSSVALGKLRDAGIGVAVDDFGTGYSSLGYLRSLPLSALKIDRSFVVALEEGDQAHAIMDAIVRLSHSLGFKVVVEGVETQEHLQVVSDLGCDLVQGFVFSRPLGADDFARLVVANRAHPYAVLGRGPAASGGARMAKVPAHSAA